MDIDMRRLLGRGPYSGDYKYIGDTVLTEGEAVEASRQIDQADSEIAATVASPIPEA